MGALTGCGVYAGYAGRKLGFLYSHEDGGVLESHDLLGWADRYFGDYTATFKS